jgi:hypothetical protein
MSTTNNRTLRQAADQKLIDGLNKHSASLASLLIGNTSYPLADLISTVQTRVSAANVTRSTRATWQNAVQAERDQRAKTKPLVSGLKQAIQVMFAGSIDSLADFGLTARKVPVVTPEKKAAAAAKAKATRAARHTMGKVQKKDIKGTVPTTAPATPPSPAPAPTPAQTPVSTPK